jgi:hypothetical protein
MGNGEWGMGNGEWGMGNGEYSDLAPVHKYSILKGVRINFNAV